MFETINERSKTYYNLTCLAESTEKCCDDPLQAQFVPSEGGQAKERIFFESVTPRDVKTGKTNNNIILDIEIKKENGGFATISRNVQSFIDLHQYLSSDFPDDTPDIADIVKVPVTTAQEMVELSYSLHAFLNKSTKVDKIMFSTAFQGFLVKSETRTTESRKTKTKIDLKSKTMSKKQHILFEIVSAKNVTDGDRKFVLYTTMMKKHILDNQPVFLKRRYSDFHNLHSVFTSRHSHKVFNNFQFPKKTLISTLSPEQIAERAKGLEQFLNLISSSELVNSHIFEMFITKKEHNHAVSHIKKNKFGDAAVILENVFNIKEKLLISPSISLLDCLLELTACLVEFGSYETAFKFALLAVQSMRPLLVHQEVKNMKIPILRTARFLAEKIGEDVRPLAEELARDSFVAFPQSVSSLMDIVRGRGGF